jgi:hypothetical protein
MKNLIENYFPLKIKSLKKDLQKAREKEPVNGYLNLFNGGKPAIAHYSMEYEDEAIYLLINFGTKPQRFLLSEQELTFGAKNYFVCTCGCRTTSLYLKDGVFACRNCHGLQYASSSINKNTKHGKYIFQQSQLNRIMDVRESVDRIFYRSQFSKRYKYWLNLCSRAGLNDEVRRANDLLVGINGFE